MADETPETTEAAATAPEPTPAAAPARAPKLPSRKRNPPRTPEERAAQRRAKAAARRRRRQQEKARRTPGQGTPPAEREPGARQVRVGTVVSGKADKTITVRIDVARRHRRYEKIVRSSTTLHAHDEGNEAHQGDVVRVVESRPLSRTKRWRLEQVLERAQ
jgi:small subunit ribosomal protein S17